MTKKRFRYTDIDGDFKETIISDGLGGGFWLFSIVVGFILAAAVYLTLDFSLATMGEVSLNEWPPEMGMGILGSLGIFFIIIIVFVGKARLDRVKIYEEEFGWDREETIQEFVKSKGITREKFIAAKEKRKLRKEQSVN